jgi:formiminotetrahydrofolate cyclodeaminase
MCNERRRGILPTVRSTVLASRVTDEQMPEDLADETIGSYLDRVTSRTAAPAGGSVAAMNAAMAAALVGMGARFTTPPADAALDVADLATRADALRDRALALAVEDEVAFTAVKSAYALPREPDAERAARSAAIRDATAAAALPPAGVVGVAREVVGLVERLLPVANRTVTGDLVAAVDAARAAASCSRLNVEVNVRALAPGDDRRSVLADVADVDELLARADQLHDAVRREVAA